MKIQLHGGFDIRSQVNQTWATYWSSIGFDGFLLDYVYYSWDDPPGSLWSLITNFRSLYGSLGIANHYVKTSPYRGVDWASPSAVAAVVSSFQQQAAKCLANGLGLAIDLEPQTPGLWAVDPSLPTKASIIHDFGVSVGNALAGLKIMCFPEVLEYDFSYPAYALAGHFWDGLISTGRAPIIGLEDTYDAGDVTADIDTAKSAYNEPASKLSPGLWPLGNTYNDHLSRPGYTTAEFKAKLTAIALAGCGEAWIYGGWAWVEDPGVSLFHGAVKEF